FLKFCYTPEFAAAATLPRRALIAWHPPKLAPTIASHGARAGRPALDPPDRPIEGGDRRSCRRPFTRRVRCPKRLANVGAFWLCHSPGPAGAWSGCITLR